MLGDQCQHHIMSSSPTMEEVHRERTVNSSEEIMRRSSSSMDAPYAMRQSRSISPSRRPPSRERPCIAAHARHAL